MDLEAEIEWLRYALRMPDRAGLEMHLVAEIESLRDALGRQDRVSLGMHFEAKIKLISDMHLEAIIERLWRCTWRP
jgi:hypothetical protein